LNNDYLKRLIIYIHQNPIHHGFCDKPANYPWSSYQTCLSNLETKLMRENVMELFVDRTNFQIAHQTVENLNELEGN